MSHRKNSATPLVITSAMVSKPAGGSPVLPTTLHRKNTTTPLVITSAMVSKPAAGAPTTDIPE